MKKNIFLSIFLAITISCLFGCDNTTTQSNNPENTHKYIEREDFKYIEYEDYNFVQTDKIETHNLDDFIQTSIDFQITPAVAAKIVKAVFAEIYDEEYVNSRECTVYDIKIPQSDLDKYGDYYTVYINEGGTDGEFAVISKEDGRLLRVASW